MDYAIRNYYFCPQPLEKQITNNRQILKYLKKYIHLNKKIKLHQMSLNGNQQTKVTKPTYTMFSSLKETFRKIYCLLNHMVTVNFKS